MFTYFGNWLSDPCDDFHVLFLLLVKYPYLENCLYEIGHFVDQFAQLVRHSIWQVKELNFVKALWIKLWKGWKSFHDYFVVTHSTWCILENQSINFSSCFSIGSLTLCIGKKRLRHHHNVKVNRLTGFIDSLSNKSSFVKWWITESGSWFLFDLTESSILFRIAEQFIVAFTQPHLMLPHHLIMNRAIPKDCLFTRL